MYPWFFLFVWFFWVFFLFIYILGCSILCSFFSSSGGGSFFIIASVVVVSSLFLIRIGGFDWLIGWFVFWCRSQDCYFSAWLLRGFFFRFFVSSSSCCWCLLLLSAVLMIWYVRSLFYCPCRWKSLYISSTSSSASATVRPCSSNMTNRRSLTIACSKCKWSNSTMSTNGHMSDAEVEVEPPGTLTMSRGTDSLNVRHDTLTGLPCCGIFIILFFIISICFRSLWIRGESGHSGNV